MLPPCVIFIERINNEININVLKKKIWPKRREYFNDFKMADLNLFCFVLFFFGVFFFFFPSWDDCGKVLKCHHHFYKTLGSF